MKVMIFKGNSFAGSYAAVRFQREGHDVITVNPAGKAEGVEFSAPHIEYSYTGNCRQMEEIVKREKPEVIIISGPERNGGNNGAISCAAAIESILQLLECSVRYNTKKVILISTMDVYGSELYVSDGWSCDEGSETSPRDFYSRSALLCEQALLKWRHEPVFSNVILRFSDLCGEGQDTESGLSGPVWDILRKNNKEGAGEKKAAGVTAARKSYNLLYIRDATDAVYKAAGDFANGIYNITGKEIVGHEELGEIIAEIRRENNNAYSAGDAPGKADTAKTKDSSPGAAFRTMKVSVRAASELAWHPVAGLQTSLEKCIKWYYSNNRLSRKSGYALSGGGSMPHEDGKNRKSGAAGDNAGAGAVNLTDETDQKTGISGELLRYAENIIFFALAVLLMQYQSDKSIYFAVDFMALYIIIIGIFFGIKHSIPAAVLAGLYSILSLAAQGIGILSLLYNLSVTVSIIEYLVIGVSIGYVVERKNNRISELLYETRLIQDDLVSINRLYEEVSEVKNEYEYRIYQYSDSYGRIYAIIRQLESLVPEEVFVNALKVVRELLGEEKISIYVADEKGLFIRRIAGGAADGAGEHALPASMRLKDKPEWKDIIDKKEVYANSFLDAAMPSVIAPVVSGDRTAAVIVIENMEFEKLNLYYINLMKVLTNLLASAFSRAQAYENEVYKKRYVDGTLILKPEEYKKSLLVRDKLVKEGSYMYSIIKINDLTTRDEKIEAARKISALIRKGDELAFNDNEELLLLLPSTSPRDAVFVKKKLDGAGLSCEITGNEV